MVSIERLLETELERLRTLAEQRKNPLYTWKAIRLCLGKSPQRALPAWCLAYVAECADGIAKLAELRNPAPSEICLAFGFTRQGRSAFVSWMEDHRAEQDARAFDIPPSAGFDTPETAFAAIKRRRNLGHDRSVRRVIKHGRGTK